MLFWLNYFLFMDQFNIINSIKFNDEFNIIYNFLIIKKRINKFIFFKLNYFFYNNILFLK
jgi:hypothetical protein